ncbi:methyltransferase domain-containing protein [Pontimicrobium aquaticum]|uniref:tRNA1(Val) (adenine(37)-N6)-methyltransferase n=2 Tax=Pontimicrobium aquaticum TaxID=2565367 RepID=A0A4U0F124_9FLAO|nr:methyltransferase domain-containing protein [Pontimicrobium aquaticum]
MPYKPFLFKKFKVNQNKSAMKIGTDAVLLGAWTSINRNPFSVLDIGAGTGVVALMLAQRCYAELIDAVEIEDNAYEQCTENFEDSPWNDRLFCYHASLEAFVEEIDETYDLIVSNPPFYSDDFKSKNNQRDLARFEDALPFDHLLDSVSKLLSSNGLFSVIIPFKEEQSFMDIATSFNLFPKRILRVKGNPNSDTKRSLIEFSFTKGQVETNDLIIENGRHQYTQDYVNLTKDFYLKM